MIMNKRQKFYTIYQPNWNRYTIADEYWNVLISNLKLDEFKNDQDSAIFMLNQVIEELWRKKEWFTDKEVVNWFISLYEESFWKIDKSNEDEIELDLDWFEEDVEWTLDYDDYLNCESFKEFERLLKEKEFVNTKWNIKFEWDSKYRYIILSNYKSKYWVIVNIMNYNDFEEAMNNFFNDSDNDERKNNMAEDIISTLTNKEELWVIDINKANHLNLTIISI